MNTETGIARVGLKERILFLIQAHPSLLPSLQSQGKVKPNTKRIKGLVFLSYIKLLASPSPAPIKVLPAKPASKTPVSHWEPQLHFGEVLFIFSLCNILNHLLRGQMKKRHTNQNCPQEFTRPKPSTSWKKKKGKNETRM